MTANRKKTAWIGVKVSPELKERVEEAARRDRRSISGFVRKTLAETFEEAERSGGSD